LKLDATIQCSTARRGIVRDRTVSANPDRSVPASIDSMMLEPGTDGLGTGQ
jgi:hypothetical protein